MLSDLNSSTSPCLYQGSKFCEKKEKIIEGLTDDNTLVVSTSKAVNDNKLSNSDKQTIDNLRNQYNNKLDEYDKLVKKISSNVTNYINRVDSSNMYLNKVIRFKTNEFLYVTNQGVAKRIPSDTIWNSTNIPRTGIMNVTIPWDNKYSTPGTIIPTTPSLVSGTPVVLNQQFGNEGSNVYVNEFIPSNTVPTYMGCYMSNNVTNITYVDGVPPAPVIVTNGNFSQPAIKYNTSSVYVNDGTSIPGWYCGWAALLNSCIDWGLPIPYPKGDQCIIIKRANYIYTSITLRPGNYTISFYACGRPCCGNAANPNPNPVEIRLHTSSGELVTKITTLTAKVGEWKQYTFNFTIDSKSTTNNYRLYVAGAAPTPARDTGIQGITIQNTLNNNGKFTINECMNAAARQGYRYFGLQSVNQETSKGFCSVTNNSASFGSIPTKTTTLTRIPLWTTKTYCGWYCRYYATLTNTGMLKILDPNGKEIYSNPSTSSSPGNYFLIVNDSGNIIINRGTGPNDVQAQIWNSKTSAGDKANPIMKASEGKNGRNWLKNGEILVGGEFIGSPNGYAALVMNSDGTLVLNKYELEQNCLTLTDNTKGGMTNSNAVYDVGLTSVPSNFGKLAYIDANSDVYTYPDTNKTYGTNYTLLNNLNTPGNDIVGASFWSATVDSCKTACNKKTDCAGFVFNKKANACFPKNKNMYPYVNGATLNADTDLYVRSLVPSTAPKGVSGNIVNTNTVKFSKYTNKGPIQNQYGIANANIVEKQQLELLQSEIEVLSKKIEDYTKKFSDGSIQIEDQSALNIDSVDDHIQNIENTNKKITEIGDLQNVSIQNILNDSDTVILQRNYEYLFWSILAAGSVLVTMNIVNK